MPIPLLSDIPFIGPLLFNHDLLVYLSFVLVVGAWWALHKTRAGLIIRAVGENPHSANALGIEVIKVRYIVTLIGGALAGLAGAYMSLAYTPMWMENMTAGRGWIALALVVFASWRIGYLVLGAYLFGFTSIMHLMMQGVGVDISPNPLSDDALCGHGCGDGAAQFKRAAPEASDADEFRQAIRSQTSLICNRHDVPS